MTSRTPENTPKSSKKSVVHRRDGAGHLDPAYAQRLREQSEMSGKDAEDARAFLGSAASREDLSLELGKEFVANATSGEDQTTERLQSRMLEEEGGPFVETGASTEFAEGVDESNPKDSTREPLPKT